MPVNSGAIRAATIIFVLILGVVGNTSPALAQQNLNPPAPAPVPTAQPAPAAVPGQQAKPPPKTFLQIFFSGGPLGIANMIALIGLSLTAAYMVFDNLMRIRRKDLIPEELQVSLRKLVEQGRLNEAATACDGQPCFLTAVVKQGLKEADSGWSEVEKAMEDATAEQAARLFRWIEYLSVIGNLAPMVGLLGTVTGMLLAFKEVADSGSNAGAAQLADGIYQALVTTVYGLVIAIPALGFFAMFRSWIDELVAAAAYASMHILEPLKLRKIGVQAPPVIAQAGPPQPPSPPRPGAR
jgi:biopolymer transport protein ExbB